MSYAASCASLAALPPMRIPVGSGAVAADTCFECAGWSPELRGHLASPRELLSGQYLIAPIPTTRRRARTRGYNQAALLAEAVADRVDTRLVEALERRRGGSTQVGLHPAERRANVRRAFTVRAEARATLKGARVLLVDDVLTTGSTAMEAARPLVQAGATQVFLSTFARALPYWNNPLKRNKEEEASGCQSGLPLMDSAA